MCPEVVNVSRPNTQISSTGKWSSPLPVSEPLLLQKYKAIYKALYWAFIWLCHGCSRSWVNCISAAEGIQLLSPDIIYTPLPLVTVTGQFSQSAYRKSNPFAYTKTYKFCFLTFINVSYIKLTICLSTNKYFHLPLLSF